MFHNYTEKLASTSVNSALCLENQERNGFRLLVGSHISLQGTVNHRRITPKQTTLLPDVNGLIPLMYLLFSPTVQIIHKKRNEPAIAELKAGLGTLRIIIITESVIQMIH